MPTFNGATIIWICAPDEGFEVSAGAGDDRFEPRAVGGVEINGHSYARSSEACAHEPMGSSYGDIC